MALKRRFPPLTLPGLLSLMLLAATISPCPALADPDANEAPIAKTAPPQLSPRIRQLEFGIFCALTAMDSAPAPGTIAGWLHVPRDRIAFHWPDESVVPASIGLAFGIRVMAQPGEASETAQARVYRPGRATPETWETSVSDMGEVNSFFRFDDESELIPGIWAFEAWDQDEMLYRVEFEVVPPAARPEIANSCGMTS
ncbi:DUF3859 domain-containing protein [Xinfangfangia sp. D13-10-4-6]|uniref:DUF3859 domain-containing protein n=1 Tax=Pseudogemmobacter hezensis TaxID=2737662 RepID=UPI001553A8C9|nr:DUF3859 domain-containing protein [Pseudogemmobacter hezensis]NPD17075.1 DUF3859 domain-containing protein [Pseudogemmobacter hezensis]